METKILEKKALTINELGKELGAIEKREMNPIQQKVFDFSKEFVRLTDREAGKLKKELQDLGIGRLTDEQIAELINYLPGDLVQLKSLFTKVTTITPEDFKRINDVVIKYRKSKK
jgi:DNA-directed RNA polymerase subunit F